MHDDGEGMSELQDDVARMVARRLREPVAASPGFDDWIMAEVRAAAGTERRSAGVGAWFSRRAEWWATGALVAVVAITVTVLRTGEILPPPRVIPAVASSAPEVHFTFSAPNASSVTVVGTFNGWDTRATPLRRSANGEWNVDLPLGAGRYNYMFVVDGRRWMLDPSAARDAADDFGTENSVVMVAGQRET